MRKFSSTEGYNATFGYNIYQDADGCIWMGTDNGVFKFDGNSFYTINQENGLQDIDIMDCVPYGKGRVLISPLLNSIAYSANNKIFNSTQDKRIRTHNAQRNKIFNDVTSDAVWLTDSGAADTLYRFSGTAIEKIAFGHKDLCLEYISGFYAIARKTDNSFVRLDLKNRTITPLVVSGKKGNFATDKTNRTVMADGKAILYYDLKAGLFDIYDITSPNTLCYKERKRIEAKITTDCRLFTDRRNNVWITDPKGGFYYIENIMAEGYDKKVFHLMTGYNINSIFQDRDGGIWLSTRNACLLYISNGHFQNALRVSNLALPYPIVKYICGTSDGGLLVSYPGHDFVSHVYKNGVQNIALSKAFSEGARYILPIPDNNYIIIGNGLANVSLNTGRVRHIPIYQAAKAVCLLGDTVLLSRSSNAIAFPSSVLLKANQPVFEDDPFVLLSCRVTAVAVLKGKCILLGTPNGCFKKTDIHAIAEKITHPALANANITSIVTLNTDHALIGTNAHGLYLYNINTGNVTTMRPVAGRMGQYAIRHLFLQQDRICWLSTNKGAVRITLDAQFNILSSYNYTFHDGLPSDNVTSIFVDGEKAYIATTEGLGILNVSETTHNTLTLPHVFINTIGIGDAVIYHPTEKIHLSHHQNNLLLSLSAIAYESMDNVTYYYYLEGLNEQWISTRNPEIRFTSLPPGNYVFHAYATNALGGKSKERIRLDIEIRPAFWQSIYFNIACILLGVLLLIFLLHFWIVKKERKKNEIQLQKRRLAELELEAIKAQINPHFIYNCLNSIQYLNYKLDHTRAQQYIDIFAKLIRMTMMYAQQSFITLEEEINYLDMYLQMEKLRLKDRLHYEIYEDGALDKKKKIPAMLIQPYVENALKHGVAKRQTTGNIVVRFAQHKEGLQIMIEDDGPGMQVNMREGSLGLRLSGTRAKSYNQLFGLDIKVLFYNKETKACKHTGSVVQINIPDKDYEKHYS